MIEVIDFRASHAAGLPQRDRMTEGVNRFLQGVLIHDLRIITVLSVIELLRSWQPMTRLCPLSWRVC